MNLPNKITFSRILLVPVFMISIMPIPQLFINSSFLGLIRQQLIEYNNFIIHYGNFIGAFIFILAASTDKIDGYLARKRNLITNLGKFMDPLADKLIITAALIALLQRGNLAVWIAILIIFREFLITEFRLVASKKGIVLSADKWGKIKMVVQSIAIPIALLKNYPLSKVTNFPIDKYAMLIALIITLFSGYNYLSKNRKVFYSI